MIKSVLHNFLGTFTSRYSAYDGYWVFGMMVGQIKSLEIALLNPSVLAGAASPVEFAINLAAQKFREQVEKLGVNISRVREAHLTFTRSPESYRGVVNDHFKDGYHFRMGVRVVSNHGIEYQSEVTVFVAPHDSSVERQSARATKPC